MGSRRLSLGALVACRLCVKSDELQERVNRFAVDVHKLTAPLFKSIETGDGARQLRRGSNGVASNYRAAGSSRSHREFTARIAIVRDEAEESHHWLEHLRATGVCDNGELLHEALELKSIFRASHTTASQREERRQSQSRTRARHP